MPAARLRSRDFRCQRLLSGHKLPWNRFGGRLFFFQPAAPAGQIGNAADGLLPAPAPVLQFIGGAGKLGNALRLFSFE